MAHSHSQDTTTAHPATEVCIDCITSTSETANSLPDKSDAQTRESTSPTSNQEITPPSPLKPSVTIEFCDRCRWAPRATWIQTELFLTFPVPILRQITLQPLTSPETGGRFRVWVDVGVGKGDELVWDRKSEGGFPELKVLKQRLRGFIQPERDLGHSDAHAHKPLPGAETA